jgi:hypothetical protein
MRKPRRVSRLLAWLTGATLLLSGSSALAHDARPAYQFAEIDVDIEGPFLGLAFEFSSE